MFIVYIKRQYKSQTSRLQIHLEVNQQMTQNMKNDTT